MQSKGVIQCPNCGTVLVRFNGHIGYCELHQWVSPRGYGYEAEAARQNERDAQAKLDREKEISDEIIEHDRRMIIERRKRRLRRIAAMLVALALIAAAVVYFVVRPSLNYTSASDKFAAGDYAEARDAYSALGDYKDSAARVLLCDAMLEVQSGHAEAAATRLEQLTGEGQTEIAGQLAEALLPVMSNWRSKGLTPQALLSLLNKADIIDPNGTLDTAALSAEAHTALLDGTQTASYTDDVNADGEPELIALNPDYTVTVYRMAADGNVRMAVDNDTAAACELTFGNRFKDTDVNAAVACFAEAYRLLPSEETRTALTGAYQLRSADYENAGDMAAAIADAKSAMDTAGTADSFTYYYELNLRNCKNGHDAATAIGLWDAFAAESVGELTRYSAKDRWQADAAQLHIALAAELAAQKDEGCITELRTAAEMGADVTDAVAEAESHFEPGLSLARLRLMEIELLGTDAAKEQAIRTDMADEVRIAIAEWKDRGISPADIPALIHLADDYGIDLAGIDRDAIYEDAAIAAAGNVAQYSFVDWDADGYEELLTLGADGILSLYGADETWRVLSTLDTRLAGSSYTIVDESAPLIITLSADNDEFVALTGTGTKLSALFREQGISRYSADGSAITFSRLLEGSIARYNEYSYDAVGTANRPVRTGVDWQESDYPYPTTAYDALIRYFEARIYDIADEAALLMAGDADAPAFAGLVLPANTADMTVYTYLTGDDETRFEVSYTVDAVTYHEYIAAVYDGGWHLKSVADSFLESGDQPRMDYDIPVVSLNEDSIDVITERGGKRTYRLLLPEQGRASFQWQAGEKTVSRDAFDISIYRDSIASNPIVAYTLQPNTARQQTKALFMSTGVYYITVTAKTGDAYEYRFQLQLEREANIEIENNDTSASATPIELDAEYYGNLLTKADVDYYRFVVDEPTAVNVELATSGSGSNSAAYTLKVYSGADGSELSSISAAGSAQLTETGNLYLSDGEYYVSVAKGTTWINDEYSITVNSVDVGHMETESNDTQSTSDDIPLNADIHASIANDGDVDWFRFTLDGDTIIQPHMSFKPTDSSSKTYVMTIMGETRHEYLKANIGGKESDKIIAPVILKAGSYYVRIENPRFVRQEYTLNIAGIAADNGESEPNDTAALSTGIVLGAHISGVLSTQDDIDYYRIVFDDQVTVALNFTFGQTTNTSNVFTLSIEQNGKSVWSQNVKGDTGAFVQQLQIPAGEYYIRVKSGTGWVSAVYELELSEISTEDSASTD